MATVSSLCTDNTSASGIGEDATTGGMNPVHTNDTCTADSPVMPQPYCKTLRNDTVRHCLLDMEYAVRGPIINRAEEMKILLSQPDTRSTLKVNRIIPANIGNPQAVGQKPLSFHRQVLSCLLNPALLHLDEGSLRPVEASAAPCTETQNRTTAADSDSDKLIPKVGDQDDRLSQSSTLTSLRCSSTAVLPEDVRERASRYLTAVTSIGAYSHSQGAMAFRKDVADWFERRDGFPCNPSTLFLTDGASTGIRQCLELLISANNHGILIPVPQYPLYSATITRLEGVPVHYYLDEEHQWRLTITELDRALLEAQQKGVHVKALVVLNPGNPTGAVLAETELVDVVRWCEQHQLVMLADEVYQDNIYTPSKRFVSLRKIVKTLNSNVELISFHSTSKGFTGECGLRGGVMQLENIDPTASAVLLKMASVALCSNTIGQALMASITNPPQPQDPSYALYNTERTMVLDALRQKADLATVILNGMTGISCQRIEGAMYAFPRITLPAAAIAAAQKKGVEPDFFYCMEMLENTGVVCVPGSGFGQLPGTYHFRVTILPPLEMFREMLTSMQEFHESFLQQYSDTH